MKFSGCRKRRDPAIPARSARASPGLPGREGFPLRNRIRWLLPLLAAFALLPQAAAEWETLENVRLAPGDSVDGDSFRVVHRGKEYTFRIFYVDAPETNNHYPERIRGQARYFSIKTPEALELGGEATKFTREFLSKPFTVHTDWSDGWGATTRYRAIVERGDRELGAELVRNGLARVSGFIPDSPWPGRRGSVWDYREELRELESEAKQRGRGGWERARTSRTKPATGTEDPTAAGLTDINTADLRELDALPGIGPVLAGRIADRRPFRRLDELDQVVGISTKTIDGLRNHATVIPPPLLPNTADYFRENVRYYVNSPVRVTIATLGSTDGVAPEGFAIAEARTIHPEGDGGRIRLFAPKDKMKAALARFAATDQPLDVRAWLRDYEGELILVVY